MGWAFVAAVLTIAGVVVGICLVSSRGAFEAGTLIVVFLFAGAFVSGLLSVALGASPRQRVRDSAYKYMVSLGLASPVYAAAVIVSQTDLTRYVATVGAVAIFMGVFIAAMLKSDVDGIRRDALELAGIVLGASAAAATLYGAIVLTQ